MIQNLYRAYPPLTLSRYLPTPYSEGIVILLYAYLHSLHGVKVKTVEKGSRKVTILVLKKYQSIKPLSQVTIVVLISRDTDIDSLV